MFYVVLTIDLRDDKQIINALQVSILINYLPQTVRSIQ
jgi:hypothetical protein